VADFALRDAAGSDLERALDFVAICHA